MHTMYHPSRMYIKQQNKIRMKTPMGQTLPIARPPKVGLAHPQAPSNTPQPETTTTTQSKYFDPTKHSTTNDKSSLARLDILALHCI